MNAWKLPHLLEQAGLAGLTSSHPSDSIYGLTADSRQVRPGWLFAVLSGSKTSGTRYLAQALAAGAVAILDDGQGNIPAGVAHLTHSNPRKALAYLASAFFHHPARTMQMAAITGTNGKTTVAAMTEAILAVANRRVGIIGTTGIRFQGHHRDNPLTTPDPIHLQATLRDMADHGCDSVVMEASSHAIHQHRTDGISWRSAVFTNLSRDHLDYHLDEENYFLAKARLFLENPPAVAVLNLDDPRGADLAQRCAKTSQVIGFSTQSAQTSAPFQARDLHLSWQGTQFQLHSPAGSRPIQLATVGHFNVANALAAAALAWSMGAKIEDMSAGLAAFTPQPGRVNLIDAGQPFVLVIDYAHTPDALQNLLNSALAMTKMGKLTVVFGCGGDRDGGKRIQMGRIAGRLGDRVIVTDDNPRSESPAAIREAILAGCREVGSCCAEYPSRAEAIRQALLTAQPGDVVIIAGKGHETVQITAEGTYPFDDRQVAQHYLSDMGYQKNNLG